MSVDGRVVDFSVGMVGVIGDADAEIRMDLGFWMDREGKGLRGKKTRADSLVKPWNLGVVADDGGRKTGERRARAVMAAISVPPPVEDNDDRF